MCVSFIATEPVTGRRRAWRDSAIAPHERARSALPVDRPDRFRLGPAWLLLLLLLHFTLPVLRVLSRRLFTWRARGLVTRDKRTLNRAPVGQGPPGPDWLAISFGFCGGTISNVL